MAFLKQFVSRHPRLTAWVVLAIGLVIILILSASHVGFSAGQWAALIVATIGLAGLCVWIIGWEEEEEGEKEEEPPEPGKPEEEKGEEEEGPSETRPPAEEGEGEEGQQQEEAQET